MNRPIACRILSNENEIDALAADWRGLRADKNAGFFSDYDWFRLWRETLGKKKNRTLCVIAAYRQNRLAGVLPLMTEKKFGCRVLEWAGNEIFDYCASFAEDEDVAHELWKTARRCPNYDIALIRDVRENSRDDKALSGFAKKSENNKAPCIGLTWQTGQDWLKSLDAKRRKDIKYKCRRLEHMGPIKLEVFRKEPIPENVIDDMMSHKIEWCRRNNKKSVFFNPDITMVFRRMAALAAKQDRLFLATLKCGETPVSHVFGFIDRGVLHDYFMSYDPEWATYSPGTVILVKTVMWAIENGLKEYDFMRGSEDYKLRYATEVRKLSVFGFARTPWGGVFIAHVPAGLLRPKQT